MTQAKAKILREATVGEPDANAEYFLARKERKNPIFIDAYYDDVTSDLAEFKSGLKFILYGQKGTGKTALLRHLEAESSKKYKTKFVAFKKEILEEAELSTLATGDLASLLIDEDEIKNSRFYHHAMKRLLLTMLLAECKDTTTPEESSEMGWFAKISDKIKNSSPGELASLAIDSVIDIVKSAKIDIAAVSNSRARLEAARLIKKSNDSFAKYCFENFKKKDLKARIFLDEMHFAYRDKTTLESDAALVRDTIMAVQNINERLIQEEIDSSIYMSVRSEFLEHTEIATADIAHTIQSYGKEISWENHPYNRSHPLFDLIHSRLRNSFGNSYTKSMMMDRFFPVRRWEDFLMYSWGKPRDIVRFFKSAKELYPNNYQLSNDEYSASLRKYSNLAWQDLRSALTAFVPKNNLEKLEQSIRAIAKDIYEKRTTYSKKMILDILNETHKDMTKEGVRYSLQEFYDQLYIVGLFYIDYTDANGDLIYHQYHRGNRRPTDKGNVHLHKAVIKAFS